MTGQQAPMGSALNSASGSSGLFGAPSASASGSSGTNGAPSASAKANTSDTKAKYSHIDTTVILQNLIAGKIDIASEMYKKRQNGGREFTLQEKHDMYYYVKDRVDEDVMEFLFPGLKEANDGPSTSPITTVTVL